MADEWYFAFGANMSSRVFVGRRGMKPTETGRARVQDWRRAFVERGFPMIEPVFAGLVPEEGNTCWGVVYRLSESDSHALDGLEGSGYERVHVMAQSEVHGQVQAFAYSTPRPVHGRKPSRRYMGLLIEGAREHGLPEEVIAQLEAEPTQHLPIVSSMVSGVAVLVEGVLRKFRS